MNVRNPSRRTPLRFGKYLLVERIAVGGMAEVFLAVQAGVEGFEKTVALKRIRPILSEKDAFVQMFLFEAKLAAQLHHPNIVQIYELGEIADNYFIAMEYVSGRDMSRVIPKAEKLGITYPLEYAMLVASNVLEGLAYAHEKLDDFGKPLNLVHRDVTPENIMVGWNGHVRLLDFGIAKASSRTDATRVGEIKGKLSYMSPEQAAGKSLDQRSDLFTLGVVLYEWVTGYKLFTGENEMAVLKAICDSHIYPPAYFRDDVPAGVEEIVMKALAKDPDDRYQTARDMLFAVQYWLQTGSDFTPTSSHLANFMKQIFADEIEQERTALAAAAEARARRTPPPIPSDARAMAPQLGEELGRSKSAQGQALIVVASADDAAEDIHVALDADELDQLRAAASRAGVAPADMIRELLLTTLKFT
ncbi:MAG: serine/threonine-protein kinase [Myxococcota bacterium]